MAEIVMFNVKNCIMPKEAHRVNPVEEGRHPGEDGWFPILVAHASRAIADNAVHSPSPVGETVQRTSRVSLKG